ncbi:MAG TPA: hypothetical protein VH678_10320 [Xanthobacteraceae bacterium]|jgi:hypothetical protein
MARWNPVRAAHWILVAGAILLGDSAGHVQAGTRPAIQSPGDAETITILLRTTLVALHQANLSGNYTVLRDISAPGFQAKNSAADLSMIFASLRHQKIDLSTVVLLEPNFSPPPSIDDQNMLRLTGTLPTRPAPVAYDLLFQPVNGLWRVFGISLRPLPAGETPVAAAPAAAAKQQPQQKAAPKR